ncbi:TAXI family TRAP transporter solute-binding subunit, partial [Microbacterium sp. NPDC055599]
MSRVGRLVAGLLVTCLALTLGACATRSDEWGDEEYTIASGGSTGVYFAYGTAVADAVSSARTVDLVAEQTAGSVDNLLRVGAGEALLGFAQGDAAADAVAGTGAFAEPQDVTAVARLYDEYLQVVVRGDSPVHDLADLAGMTVSLGAENSGVNVIAGRVLDAAGV